MGGGHYSQDVAYTNRAEGRVQWSRREVHPALSPRAYREVNNATPIVIAMDVTRSRGDDTRLLYNKLPELMGAIEAHGYVDEPGISFAAIGDADADQAPLQVGQFEADNRLDEVLERIWIEEGGGGTGQESYELAAWFYAQTDCVKLREGRGGRGFFFFIGDEGFYPTLSRQHVQRLMGEDPGENISSSEVFRRLQEKFHVFLIYPGKSLEERQSDIDAEIRSRVLAAGGQHDDVDVRISLIWDNRNDLDLHVFPPSGEEIYFRNKSSRCGGVLDVDRNVRGETTTPVENVRWSAGTAPGGSYRVVVQNYGFHEQDKEPTPWRLEVEVDGDLLHYEGVISPNKQTGAKSDMEICTFEFEPDPQVREAARAARYHAYSDEVVLGQWQGVLPAGHILKVREPEAIFDVLLGALAVANGRQSAASYLATLRSEGADAARLAAVEQALSGVVSLV